MFVITKVAFYLIKSITSRFRLFKRSAIFLFVLFGDPSLFCLRRHLANLQPIKTICGSLHPRQTSIRPKPQTQTFINKRCSVYGHVKGLSCPLSLSPLKRPQLNNDYQGCDFGVSKEVILMRRQFF